MRQRAASQDPRSWEDIGKKVDEGSSGRKRWPVRTGWAALTTRLSKLGAGWVSPSYLAGRACNVIAHLAGPSWAKCLGR